MAKKKTYFVNGKTFNTQKELVDCARSIRDAYKDHQDLVPSDLEFMIAYIWEVHNEPEEKVGVGIAKMWVQKNDIYPHRGFMLERVNGTRTDFSFIPAKKTAWSEFAKACREAVRDYVIRFRILHFQNHAINGKVICSVSGQPIAIHESHVDHEPPQTFKSLVERFIREKQINLESVLLTGGDNVIGTGFVDQDIRKKWLDYHQMTARLRVIRGWDNLSTVKKMI